MRFLSAITLKDLANTTLPTSGSKKIYAKQDGLYILDSAGVETKISGGSQGTITLDELQNVIISLPHNNQVLKYNGTAWVNAAETPTEWGSIAGTLSTQTDLQNALNSKSNTNHAHDWIEIQNKPLQFPPTTHTHAIGDVSGLQLALDGKANTIHTHNISDVTNLQSSLDSKINSTEKGAVNGVATLDNSGLIPASQSRGSSLTMNSNNYVITLTDARGETTQIDLPIESLFQSANYNSSTQTLTLTTASGSPVNISLAELVDLPEIVVSNNSNPGVTPSSGQKVYFRTDNGNYWVSNGSSWLGPFLNITSAERTKLAGVQEGATANATDAQLRDRATHTGTQAISTITNLQTNLDNKSNVGHTHNISDVTNLQSSLDLKAPLASPALSGTPTAPTATSGTNTTQIATTAFVQTGLNTKANTTHTHSISDVTNLQTTLDGKVNANTTITGATKTKVTYDSKGLVTAGADATTVDINDSTNRRYVTDAQLTVVSNTSGINTGDETTQRIGTLINSATAKTTPADNDQIGLMDSAASNILKKLSWLNIKTNLKTYFDSLYQSVLVSGTNIKTINGESVLGSGNLTIIGGGEGNTGDGNVANAVKNSGTTFSLTTTEQGLLSITITPTNVDAKVFLIARMDAQKDGGTTVRSATMRLRRGTTNSDTQIGGDSIINSINVAAAPFGPAVIQTFDEPNTTSAVTYTLRALSSANLTATRFEITVFEINAKGEKGEPGDGGGGTWGSITGTLSDQTDLQAELTILDNKFIPKAGGSLANLPEVDISTFGGQYYGEGITTRYNKLHTYFSNTVGSGAPNDVSEFYQTPYYTGFGVNDWNAYFEVYANANSDDKYSQLYLWNFDGTRVNTARNYHNLYNWEAKQTQSVAGNTLKEIFINTNLSGDFGGSNYYWLKSDEGFDKNFETYADPQGWGSWHTRQNQGWADGRVGIDLWTNWGFNAYGGEQTWNSQFDLFAGEDMFYTAINNWEYYQFMSSSKFSLERGYFVHAPETIKLKVESELGFEEEMQTFSNQTAISIKGGFLPHNSDDHSIYSDRFYEYPVLPSVQIASIETRFSPARDVTYGYNGMPTVLIGTDRYDTSRHGVHLGTTVLQEDRSLGNYYDTVRMGFSSMRFGDLVIGGYKEGTESDLFSIPSFENETLAQTSWWIFGNDYNYQQFSEHNNIDYTGKGNEIYNEPGYSEHEVYYNDYFPDSPKYTQKIFAQGLNPSSNYFWQGIQGYTPSYVYSGFYADGDYNDMWISRAGNDISIYGGIYNYVTQYGGMSVVETVVESNTFKWENARTYNTYSEVDLDDTLPQRAFYKVSGDRTVYQKKSGDVTPGSNSDMFLLFEQAGSFDFFAPYNMKITAIEKNNSATITIKVNNVNYTFGNTISKFDDIKIESNGVSKVIIKGDKI
jgi:hypothetical protein